MTVLILIPWLFKLFYLMIVVELLSKMIYLCNELLFQKLLFRISGKHLRNILCEHQNKEDSVIYKHVVARKIRLTRRFSLFCLLNK